MSHEYPGRILSCADILRNGSMVQYSGMHRNSAPLRTTWLNRSPYVLHYLI